MCYTSKWMIIRAGAGFHRFRVLPPVCEAAGKATTPLGSHEDL